LWNFYEMELSKDCLSHKIFIVNQQGIGKLQFAQTADNWSMSRELQFWRNGADDWQVSHLPIS